MFTLLLSFSSSNSLYVKSSKMSKKYKKCYFGSNSNLNFQRFRPQFFLTYYDELCCCYSLFIKPSLTLMRPHGLQPSRLLCPWDFPGKNSRVGFHFFLQGIFPMQRSNPCLLSLLHWQTDSLPLSHQEAPVMVFQTK